MCESVYFGFGYSRFFLVMVTVIVTVSSNFFVVMVIRFAVSWVYFRIWFI